MATEAIVVPVKAEAAFLASYEFLDSEAVPCGPEDDRDSVRSSPVVPGSALCVPFLVVWWWSRACLPGLTHLVCGSRVADDKDGYVLYTVVVLRKFLDSFRDAVRAKRWSVREFKYDPATAGTATEVLAKAELDAMSTLVRDSVAL